MRYPQKKNTHTLPLFSFLIQNTNCGQGVSMGGRLFRRVVQYGAIIVQKVQQLDQRLESAVISVVLMRIIAIVV